MERVFPSSPDFAFELSEALADVRPRDIPKDEWRPGSGGSARRWRFRNPWSATIRRRPPTLHRKRTICTVSAACCASTASDRSRGRLSPLPGSAARARPPVAPSAGLRLLAGPDGAEPGGVLGRRATISEAMREIEGGLAALKPHLQGDATATPAVEMDEQLRGMLDDLKRRP